MKYFIRSIKYLFYFLIIFFLIVSIIFLLTTAKQPGMTFTDLFDDGALPKLAIFFILVAAVYPALGFVKRKVYLNGEFAKYRNIIVSVFDETGLALEEETADTLIFRQKKTWLKINRMYEDRITVNISDNPIIIDGYRKDVDRIVRTVNYKIRREDIDQSDIQ
ncbi:MAG: hypothetical protein PHD11_01710 [Bacteroidales bacterium]|nr:hypothetical protein [Bacteroidales bacterium]MDD4670072.1 hypothetical protein [Bacteroidales bacterium]